MAVATEELVQDGAEECGREDALKDLTVPEFAALAYTLGLTFWELLAQVYPT